MRSLAFVCAIVLAGCASDAAGESVCTGAAYDLCLDEHNCANMKCQTFATQNLEVCTIDCSATAPCPNDATGAPGTCDNNLCRPAKANSCHL